MLAILAKFRHFLEQRLFGDSLERIVALENREQLFDWADEAPPGNSDLRLFLQVSDALQLQTLGTGHGPLYELWRLSVGG